MQTLDTTSIQDDNDENRQQLRWQIAKHMNQWACDMGASITYPRPIVCETTDEAGDWILVSLMRWRDDGKWDALDEDGEEMIVDPARLRNPQM